MEARDARARAAPYSACVVRQCATRARRVACPWCRVTVGVGLVVGASRNCPFVSLVPLLVAVAVALAVAVAVAVALVAEAEVAKRVLGTLQNEAFL